MLIVSLLNLCKSLGILVWTPFVLLENNDKYNFN